jgi:5-deoxy-D-glucuronate isomerase
MNSSQPLTGTRNTNLLVGPERFTNRVENFGFEYLEFESVKLPAGQVFRAETVARELAIVLLGGVCSVPNLQVVG